MFMKKILLFVVTIFSSLIIFAQTTKIDGIYYTVLSTSDKTLAVTQNQADLYSGDIVVPAVVDYDGDYDVVELAEQAFSYCKSLTSVILPNSIKIIGTSAFENATGLTSVTLGNSVTTIGSNVFYGCSALTELELPSTIASIGKFLLSGTTVEKVTILSQEPPTVDAKTFANFATSDAVLYVPYGCSSAYSESPWSTFKEIIELPNENEGSQSENTAVQPVSRATQFSVSGGVITSETKISVIDILGNYISHDVYSVSLKKSGIYFVLCGGKTYKIYVR